MALDGSLTTTEMMQMNFDRTSDKATPSVPFTYATIGISAQTTVKSSPGALHGVAVLSNNISALAFYDNVISGGTTIFTLPASAMSTSTWWQFDTKFNTGLTVSSGSSNTSVVISYL